MRRTGSGSESRGFSFVEIMAVVVVIGILAAMVVPRFATASDEARTSALESAVAGVRTSIAGYRTQAIITGADPYPTLSQLTTTGTVVEGAFPANPYNNLSTVQSVSSAAAASRTVSATSTYGWNYYVDNSATPPVAVFYANSDDETTASDGAGGVKSANEL
jgi:prepilin-type N-terminal cleavage/methylation domain-containing protein